MPIEKSTGVTPTERLLAQLCENTFLKIWSYPNPYKADSKELCDVMAVFENHIFLFFDRESRKFDNTNGDVDLQWTRWHKNVIEAQIRTSIGAKKYVLEHPGQVYLDSKCTISFPIPLPKNNAIVHNIIVAHGAAEACKRACIRNVTGSLAMFYSKKDLPKPNFSKPNSAFSVFLNSNEPVHVLDTSNLEIILKELDTVSDFTAYLMAKEEAIRKYDILTYCGEEDLLGDYFSNFDGKTQKNFIGTSDKRINVIFVPEGKWLSVLFTNEYQRRKAANKVSELWDKLIQRTGQNALDGKLGGNGNVFNGQSAIHEMAKEPRLFRRNLSELMKRAIDNFPGDGQSLMRDLCVLSSYYKNKVYVFLQVHHPNILDYDNDYRPKRQTMLEIACGVTKNKYPHFDTVIGIAIDAPKFRIANSEDFMLLDCKEWTEEDREYYQNLNKEIKFLETEQLKKNIIGAHEFPKTNDFYKPSKIGRNELCPCGSGNKYKKCCMK